MTAPSAPSAQPLPVTRPGPAADGILRSRVWDQVCRHIDGIAIGSTVAAFHARGMAQLIAGRERISAGELRSVGANAGYLHVAIRLLADQGWVACAGEPGTDALLIEPTAAGRTVLAELADGYRLAAGFLPLAGQIGSVLREGAASRAAERDLGAFVDLMLHEWHLPPRALPVRARHQVVSHLDGHLVAPVMLALAGRGIVGSGREIRLGEERSGSRALLRAAVQILACQGWAVIDRDVARVTPAGAVAVRCAPQYAYPVAYLATLRRVPELIFGDPGHHWAGLASGHENHLDRELDIRFSGKVFTATCREPFLEMALPLFNREPVRAQPAMVVDAGCGDGSMLEALYSAIRSGTRRGACLGDHPLHMVGIEPSPAARRTAAARLQSAGIPALVIDGDIADPESLGRELGSLGLDASDALHVSKSVIHDRAYHAPAEADPAASAPPPSSGAFALPDGTAIPPAKIAISLAALFRSWRPLARRHGLMVIEAHTAPPEITAALIGRSLATVLDATHGYSCQYPVEPEVFAWAAHAAGLRCREHRDLVSAGGHALLTIDHFTVGAPAGGPDSEHPGPAGLR